MRRRKAAAPTAADTLRPFLFDVPVPGDGSVEALRAAIAAPDVESRVALSAWTALRAHGVPPEPPVDRQVLGVVVELPIGGSHDIVATFADGGGMRFGQGPIELLRAEPMADELMKAAMVIASRLIQRTNAAG